MDESNIPGLPEGIEIPDTPEVLLTPRYYRKQAQRALIYAAEASAGRSGLSHEEKVAQVQNMRNYLEEALSATTLALELMETGESQE